MPPPNADSEDERLHFATIITTFRQYSQHSLSANNRRRKDIYTLSSADRALLDGVGYKQKLHDIDERIAANARFLDEVVKDPEIFGHYEAAGPDGASASTPNDGQLMADDSKSAFDEHHAHAPSHTLSPPSHTHTHGGSQAHTHSPARPEERGPASAAGASKKKPGRYRPTEFDMDKLRSTLKQLVRDWSAEGASEREACYKPMTDALLEHFSDIPQEERVNFNVLVPGAGLGRLAWDIANLGFACQGNEFSHYMLLSSFFILNRTDEVEKHTIYPYIHSFSNMPTKEALLRPVRIPDILPSSLPPNSSFSLVAGDFEEIYGDDEGDMRDGDAGETNVGHWDAVVTCFFIDTAKNIVNYLRIIHRILAPGGIWINLGPLLWHWENNTTNDPSIELDLAEVKALARAIGFEIKVERTIRTTYTNNAQSMLGYMYDAAFWTATKAI